tara:strand:+ start:1162 stop:1539 length:378 start_codon:yes stop_codon:yes gene_type:complete
MKNQSSNKTFGILFFVVLLLVGIWPVLNNENPRVFLVILSLLFLILGLLNSKLLTPLNILWIKLGEVLGKFISPIVMFFIYFTILTPLSFLIRITGKDLLKIKYSKKKSYWITRKKDVGPMNRQF